MMRWAASHRRWRNVSTRPESQFILTNPGSTASSQYSWGRAALVRGANAELDITRTGTSGLLYGLAKANGASPSTQQGFRMLGGIVDGLALAGAAARGGTIQPFTGQNSLTIVNGRTRAIPNPYGKTGGPEHQKAMDRLIIEIGGFYR